MLCLGIESTAHTFGISLVDSKGKVLSNTLDSYTTEQGGMIPYKVADHHVQVCDKVLKQAAKKIKLKEIDLISYSASPGLGHALRIGSFVARNLALKLNKPIIGVNHCIAHLEIGSLTTKSKDPIMLYASGANTQIIGFSKGKYRIFGETLDQGVGNFLDSFARHAGMGFPGGPKIDKLALKGKKLIPLPYSVKGMDVSFGGLLTNVKHKLNHYKLEDLCYSIQETVFAMLLEVSERALAHCNKKELLLAGGVCCNKRLQKMAKTMCKESNYKCFIPENQYLIDNAAMIAWLGIIMHKAKNKLSPEKATINPYERTDQVKVNWR